MQPNFFTLQVLFRKDNHALLGQKKTHMAKTYLPEPGRIKQPAGRSQNSAARVASKMV
jgi:hypothetical protein